MSTKTHRNDVAVFDRSKERRQGCEVTEVGDPSENGR